MTKEQVILVIDDQPTNLGLIADQLQTAGFDMRVSQSGKEGLEMAKHIQPCLILLDVVLPDINGFVLCRHIKSDVSLQAIPIIFMTSLTDIEDKIKGFDAGGVDYITKPIQKEELQARVQTHISLAQLQNKLEQMVAQQTEELVQANESLREEMVRRSHIETQLRQSQKMEALGKLTSGISHDFNNMLTTIVCNLDLLNYTLHDEGQQNFISRIRRAVKHAEGLTSQLLAFSRKQRLKPESVNLSDTVHGINQMIQWVLKENIVLESRLAPSLKLIQIDATQIEQVVMNLIINAADAMEGGGTLTIETANTTFNEPQHDWYPELAPGDYAMLAVSDTGVGMSADIRNQIFDPFFTTKERGKGTGLGLATVLGIVTQSGGHIQVDTHLGKGTVFKVCFPPSTSTSKQNVSKITPKIENRQATILVVEDDKEIREVLKQILQSRGHTIISAASGIDIRESIATYPKTIDLVITDIGLPGGENGFQVATFLRNHYSNLKTLYISGYMDDVNSQDDTIDLETNFLPKPFSLEDLCEKVNQVLVDDA